MFHSTIPNKKSVPVQNRYKFKFADGSESHVKARTSQEASLKVAALRLAQGKTLKVIWCGHWTGRSYQSSIFRQKLNINLSTGEIS